MKSNFIRDEKMFSSEKKGIAIHIPSDLLEKIEQQNIPRNDVITEALVDYFGERPEKQQDPEEIPIEVYDEIYGTLHNLEITPLKRKLDQARKTINLLENQINDLQKDKEFLMRHCDELINTFQKQKRSLFSKTKKK